MQHFSLEIAVGLVAALKEAAISVPSVATLSFLLTVWWTLGALRDHSYVYLLPRDDAASAHTHTHEERGHVMKGKLLIGPASA